MRRRGEAIIGSIIQIKTSIDDGDEETRETSNDTFKTSNMNHHHHHRLGHLWFVSKSKHAICRGEATKENLVATVFWIFVLFVSILDKPSRAAT